MCGACAPLASVEVDWFLFMNEVTQEQRDKAKRTAIVLAVVAVSLFIGFIVMTGVSR